MASLYQEQVIAVSADRAWAALMCVDRAHALFAPVLTDCTMTDDVRTVTFANGMMAAERIVTIDDRQRRLVYCVLGDMFELHSAAMRIVPVDDESCRFVWTSDFLPEERAEMVGPLMAQGAAALARNIEAGALG